MIQFAAHASFLALVVVIGIIAGMDDVQTGHLSQAINVVWVGLGFWFHWKLIPNDPALHTLAPSCSLLVAGFVEIVHTAKSINRYFPNGIFAEAATNAFTTVSVVFLNDKLGMTGTQIGIVFFVILVATLSGSKFGAMVTQKQPQYFLEIVHGRIFDIYHYRYLGAGRKRCLVGVYLWSLLAILTR
eukprot:scaffold85006_cov63-Attheya_sp.AAC.1